MDLTHTYTAFQGSERLVTGSLEQVLRTVKDNWTTSQTAALIFDDATGKQADFDLRGSIEDVLARALPPPQRTGPGRPKLGVVSREVSLLPRHWEWLESQPNGASAALRRLIDAARQADPAGAQLRSRMDAVGRVITVLAGDLTGFEEAYRALYARDWPKLAAGTGHWPTGIQSYIADMLEI